MTHIWQLQEAKNKFNRVAENALNNGPQIITRRRAEVAIVLSYAEYQRILAARQRLSDFFRESPLAGIDLDLTRDTSDAKNDIQV